MAIQEGDRVLLPDFGGQKVKVDKDELLVYREEEIVAVLKH
jgi:co-chaperonin GroES (HSP10)